MRKIFLYECKRLLWNKFFAGLVLVLLFYGWQVLRRVTILGVSHTAPFSPWSFGDFLSRMLPLLWIGALFFLTFFTSEKARRAAVLTDAAPLPPRRYALARPSGRTTENRTRRSTHGHARCGRIRFRHRCPHRIGMRDDAQV